MIDLYYIRHCATLENEQDIIQGQSIGGTPSPLGKKQTADLVSRISRVPFAAIYHADKSRTEYVAGELQKAHPRHSKLFSDPRLRERGFGELEGQKETLLGTSDEVKAAYYAVDTEGLFATAEPLASVRRRIHHFLDTLFSRHTDGEIAAVSSQWIISYSLNELFGEQILPETYRPLPNCGVAHLGLEKTNGGIHVARYNFNAQRFD